MDSPLALQDNVSFAKRNKFASQQIRKKYMHIKQQRIRRKKSKNRKKHNCKIRRNSFIRQSLKSHITDDCDKYNYNYNLSQCYCDFDFNDNNHCHICSECLSNNTTQSETKISENETLNLPNLPMREQKFQPYFGYNYQLSKTKASKWNIKNHIKNYKKKHRSYDDRLYLLLQGLFHQSFTFRNYNYATCLFIPNDICNIITNYVCGRGTRHLSKASKRCMAGIYWFANIINDFMNNATNQCELERNYNNNNNNKNKNKNRNRNRNRNEKSTRRERFNILKFMYVGGNTLSNILFSHGDLNTIDIVLDMYQLTRHFEQHLKLYHSKHKSIYSMKLRRSNSNLYNSYNYIAPSEGNKWEKIADWKNIHENNLNCKCIFWQYYYNKGKVVTDMDYIIPSSRMDMFNFGRYVCRHRYSLNVNFIVCIFDDILNTLKINPNTWQWDFHPKYDRLTRDIWPARTVNAKCLTSKKNYVYNGFNLETLTFRIFNIDVMNIHNYKYKNNNCRDMIGIQKYIPSYCSFRKLQYYTRRSVNLESGKKIKDIEINSILYPFKLRAHFDYLTTKSMRIDLNSFVINNDNNNSNSNNNNNNNNNNKNFYNLKNMIKNWKCNYNYEIHRRNKCGLMYLLDIEKRSIMAPDIDLIDEYTFAKYFWRLVQFCEKLMDKNEFDFWNIDKKHFGLIKKYCHDNINNRHFWHENFICNFLTSRIEMYDKYYYSQLRRDLIPYNYVFRTSNGSKIENCNKEKIYCCYYKMKMDNHNDNNNNNNNNNNNTNTNNRKQNVYLNRFKVFEYFGFDKILKLKFLNDKSFGKKFVEEINGYDMVIAPLPMKIEFNYCLLQFNYLNCLKNCLKQSKTSSNRYMYNSGYKEINDCEYKFKLKLDDIIKYCQMRHKDHAPFYMSRQEEQRVRFEVNRQREKQKRGGGTKENWYSFRLSLEPINEWLVGVEYLIKKENEKKWRDIYGKRINFRKKKNKKHKLFKQTKKVSKRRSRNQRIMDKKYNKKSKREKYQKRNFMSVQQEYHIHYSYV